MGEKRKDRNKKKRVSSVILGILSGLLPVVLLFCTFYGDEVYQAVTPKVQAEYLNSAYSEKYYLVDKKCMTEDGCVYLVEAESGFSREIYRIRKQFVGECDIAEKSGLLMLPKDIVPAGYIVSDVRKAQKLKDGDKVLIMTMSEQK